MKWWKYILGFLITPLGTPVSFALWIGIVIDPGSLIRIISDLPKSLLYIAPTAYIISMLISIPAIVILSRKMWLPFTSVVFAGTLMGTITGLCAGFHMSDYDMNGVINYFTFDLLSIYAPSTISGMICAIMYWVMRTTFLREKG